MKLTVKLDHEALVQAVSEFLRRQMGRPIEIEHVEYLDEDVMWQVRLALIEKPVPPVVLDVEGVHEKAGIVPGQACTDVDLGEGYGDLGEGGVQARAPDDDGWGDGDELPPLDEADLEKLGIDIKTPEGRIKAKEARRSIAKNRGGRERNLHFVG